MIPPFKEKVARTDLLQISPGLSNITGRGLAGISGRLIAVADRILPIVLGKRD